MSRTTYEQHRANKAAGLRRRGSIVESETDAESLASFATHQSGSSYLSSSYSYSPRITSDPYSVPYQRTLSGSSQSQSSFSISPKLPSSSSALSSPRAQYPTPPQRSSSNLSRSTLEVPRERDKSAARVERAKRRAEREQRSTLSSERYDSPLRRWMRWMSKMGMSGWSLPVGLAGVMVLKGAVGLGGFSGQNSPPMHGDFEAQRHWLEITLHRPILEWYTYGPEWWQLDYPPLTAYTSYFLARIGTLLDPSWFALDTSRRNEDPDLITFMRMSVLTLEGMVWWSAVVVWAMMEGSKTGRSWRSQMTGIMTVLLQPSLALVDNGHFQYNSVLLGLSLWSVIFLSKGYDMLACVAFSLALGFKQMGLYYAPAIGCYLLGKCIWLGPHNGFIHLVKLGITTLSTFGLLFLPWIRAIPDFGPIGFVFHRMFPFARGIFEDKVANFWCASNVVIKWKRLLSVAGMARFATVITLLALLPTIAILLYSSYALAPNTAPSAATNGNHPTTSSKDRKTPLRSPTPPTIRLLLVALFTSSLSFFLFSFQVHEKSILLPLMPLTLLMISRGSSKDGRDGGDELWEMGVLINNVAVFSMWPLLVRDGQALQYVVVTLLWNYTVGYSPVAVTSAPLRYFGYLVYFAIAIWHLLEVSLNPPARYPDLYLVLNVLISFGTFGIAWLWGTRKLVEGAWAIGGIGGSFGGGKPKIGGGAKRVE